VDKPFTSLFPSQAPLPDVPDLRKAIEVLKAAEPRLGSFSKKELFHSIRPLAMWVGMAIVEGRVDPRFSAFVKNFGSN
jgi:hypothetical protein